MTRVRAMAEGSLITLTLSGHATGRADVCAAVSTIACGLAGYLCNAEKRGNATVLTCNVHPGAVQIQAKVDAGGRGAWESAVLSLLQLQETAPECVSMEEGKNFLLFGGENTENR